MSLYLMNDEEIIEVGVHTSIVPATDNSGIPNDLFSVVTVSSAGVKSSIAKNVTKEEARNAIRFIATYLDSKEVKNGNSRIALLPKNFTNDGIIKCMKINSIMHSLDDPSTREQAEKVIKDMLEDMGVNLKDWGIVKNAKV